MKNTGEAVRRFNECLDARIRNGLEEAEPFAKAWLAVVRVPNMRGVPFYEAATCEAGASPEIAVIPVVPYGLPFNLMALGLSATWSPERVSVHWFGRGQQNAAVRPDGLERNVLLEFSGATFAVFLEKSDATAWAGRRSVELRAAHRASVAAYRRTL